MTRLSLTRSSRSTGSLIKEVRLQSYKTEFKNDDQNLICTSLEGSLDKISKFWQRRENLYISAKGLVESFKKKETELFDGNKKSLTVIKGYVSGMLSVSNELEDLMNRYYRMGSEMKKFVYENLEKLFTEQHLIEQVSPPHSLTQDKIHQRGRPRR